MNILDGIKNFLQYINDNWTVITIIIALIIAIVNKARAYFSKSNEEKFEIAKKQIQETILKFVTDAEMDYQEWVKAGGIKRSQVIEKIYAMYPILSKTTDQDELILWLDDVINNSLEVLRSILEQNEKDGLESELVEE